MGVIAERYPHLLGLSRFEKPKISSFLGRKQNTPTLTIGGLARLVPIAKNET